MGNEFQAYRNCKKHAEWKPPLGSESFEKNESFGNLPPSDASLAPYLQKRKKTRAKRYLLQMKGFYKHVISSANPSQDFGLKTKQLLPTL